MADIKAQNQTALASVKAIYDAADEATTLLDGMQQAAEAAGTTLNDIYADAEQAKTSADTAFTNLAQVQSVLDVVNWIATHGTYVKATTFNPNATYYTLTATQVATPSDDDKDSQGVLIYYELDSGIYVRTTDTSVDEQKTYYRVTGTPVSQPSAEHIADYYTLAVSEAMADYIQAHLALTSEGLYVMKDGSEWKVQIADDGVCILDPDNRSANQMTGDGSIVGYEDETHVEIDYHSLQLIARGETTPYFWVSDLRDKNDYYQATIVETFTADGSHATFSVQLSVSAEVSATDSSHSSNTATRNRQVYTFATTPSEGATITIVYKTTSEKAKAYTLGLRESGIVGAMSVAEGYNTIASGYVSHAEGDNTIASGYVSHAEGYNTKASGNNSHAEGSETTASGIFSHAEGDKSNASGFCSHAEGYGTTASGWVSHAEGSYTTASGDYSHAEGRGTTVSSYYSHAEGDRTTASSICSHAEGRGTTASGLCSHAGGGYTHASRNYQTVIGKYNKILSGDGTTDSPYVSTDAAFIIGGGTAQTTSDSKDIFSVGWDGNVKIAINTTATSGTDKEIYDALVALGWTDCIV